MHKEYLTVSGEGFAELEEKRSRFIATVKPVINEDEAAAFIAGVRAKYWNASHNVYAYYICGENTVQKFSDDGEPSGTAGLPVLEAVKKLGVQDVAVVVTRYFGGILLGAAGLVRSYGKCAAMGIEAAGIVKRVLCVETVITLDYSLLGKIQALIALKGYKVKDAIYTQNIELRLYIPVDEYEAFSSLLAETTNARAAINAGRQIYA